MKIKTGDKYILKITDEKTLKYYYNTLKVINNTIVTVDCRSGKYYLVYNNLAMFKVYASELIPITDLGEAYMFKFKINDVIYNHKYPESTYYGKIVNIVNNNYEIKWSHFNKESIIYEVSDIDSGFSLLTDLRKALYA